MENYPLRTKEENKTINLPAEPAPGNCSTSRSREKMVASREKRPGPEDNLTGSSILISLQRTVTNYLQNVEGNSSPPATLLINSEPNEGERRPEAGVMQSGNTSAPGPCSCHAGSCWELSCSGPRGKPYQRGPSRTPPAETRRGRDPSLHGFRNKLCLPHEVYRKRGNQRLSSQQCATRVETACAV